MVKAPFASDAGVRSRRWATCAAVLAMLVSFVVAGQVRAADFGFAAFDGQVSADAGGSPFTQAGGHPFSLSTNIDFNLTTHPLYGSAWPVEPTKDVFVQPPPGLIGYPVGIKQCTGEQLAYTPAPAANVNGPLCPAESQVGLATVKVNFLGSVGAVGPIPVFEMVPPPNVPARFGLNIANTVITLDAELHAGDYAVSFNSKNVSEGVAVLGVDVTLWGYPASPDHDAERYCPGAASDSPGCGSTAAVKPFLRNPTACTPDGVGLQTFAQMDSWTHPGVFAETSFTSHNPPGYPLTPDQWGSPQGPTGCDQVPFDASFTAAPSASPPTLAAKAGAPSGYTFDLTMPQDDDPDTGIAPSDLKKAVVTLPKGVRVNPAAADGLQACSSTQIALKSVEEPTCPDASRVGTVTIDTPLLANPIDGFVYLAKPHDNPSDTLLGIYIAVRAPGATVKLAGRVDADPVTGQLTATFDNNPQVPFSHLHLVFNDGPRAQLVSPPKCGTYVTNATLTSWSGKTVSSHSSFDLSRDGAGAPCPASQFKPGFDAGVVNPAAGSRSPFLLTLTREDGDEELEGLDVTMPPGITAKIADVPLCPSAQAASGTCGAGSLIGSVVTKAGAGPNPFAITNGRVYLTEGYKGGAFGLSIVVPAVAGPFDLGNVNVRASIQVDPDTAQLKVVSDPLPTVLQGIPLQVRLIHVAIDRDRFIISPTNCREKQITGQATSTEGTVANLASRFQVGDCSSLLLNPRLRLEVGSKGHTTVGKSTPFTTTLTQGPDQSNLKSVKVTLPLALNARLDVVTNACTLDEFNADNCEKARAGTATAISPLLKDPLSGGVFFVKHGHSLPDLMVALRGQVAVNLDGVVRIPASNQLSTNFNAIPDVPVSKFVLKLRTGKNGPLGVAENLCTPASKRARATIVIRGQNGDVVNSSQRLKINGCAKKAKKQHRARR